MGSWGGLNTHDLAAFLCSADDCISRSNLPPAGDALKDFGFQVQLIWSLVATLTFGHIQFVNYGGTIHEARGESAYASLNGPRSVWVFLPTAHQRADCTDQQ